MGWATRYIEKLQKGESVQFRPKGNSMEPLVKSGQLVKVSPLTKGPIKGDIVLCKVNGRQYLHLVTAIKDNRFQISNNKGHINGWIGISSIYGKLEWVWD